MSMVGTILAALAVAIATAVTLLVIVLAVIYTVHPGEEAADHPKRSILRDDR